MKNLFKTIYQVIVSMAMAFVGAMMCIHFEIGYWAAPIVAFFAFAIVGALITGVFDEREKSRYGSIKHYDGRRSYGQAAVFIGTACLFVGSIADCEELADGLHHYAQQAHVQMLSGEETNFEIL